MCNAKCIKRIPDSLYNQILHQIFSTAKNEKTKNFHTYGIRIAIGIGGMRIVNTEQGIWDGEAIYLSGRALEEMSSLNKGTMSVHTSKSNYLPLYKL